MSLDHLPAGIEQGIQSYADALHISHDEAVIKILETGLTAIKPAATIVPPVESRQARDAAHQSKLDALSKTAPETADAVFGAFADLPGFRESIDAVIARRAQRYGLAE